VFTITATSPGLLHIIMTLCRRCGDHLWVLCESSSCWKKSFAQNVRSVQTDRTRHVCYTASVRIKRRKPLQHKLLRVLFTAYHTTGGGCWRWTADAKGRDTSCSPSWATVDAEKVKPIMFLLVGKASGL